MRATCIYCGRAPAHPENPFSLEHIWPRALGGELCSDLFKTRHVCARCNNLAGQWVDGAFLKSWFLQNELSLAAQEFLEPDKPTAVPLLFFGELPEFPTPSAMVCERWGAPGGSHVYNVRPRDEPEWFGFAGGKPRRRKEEDAGRAYVAIASANEYWALCDLFSFTAQFARAKRYCVTDIKGLNAHALQALCPPADPHDQFQKTEIEFIRARTNNTSRVDMSVRLDYSHRFLAKLALGLGFRLLGEPFLASPYTQSLRRAMWERDFRRRRKLSVRGTDFLRAELKESLDQILFVRGAWVLLLQPSEVDFALVVCTPTGSMATVVLSDDPMIWRATASARVQDGTVFVIQPQQRFFEGPITLPQFLAHQARSISIARLADLENKRVSLDALPPKHPASADGSRGS